MAFRLIREYVLKYLELGGKGPKKISYGIRLRIEAYSYKNNINYLQSAYYTPDPRVQIRISLPY